MSTEEAPIAEPPSTDEASIINTIPIPPRTSNAGRKRRSCLTCSKRKVKCDKQQPCHNCAKIGSECIFPRVVQNRSQYPSTPEVVEMLQRLEKVVETLKPREQARAENPQGPQGRADGDDDEQRSPTQRGIQDGEVEMTGIEPHERDNSLESQKRNYAWPSPMTQNVSSTYKGPGKIIQDQGRDIYVRRWFWDEADTEDTSDLMTDDEDFIDTDEPNHVLASLGGLWSVDINSREPGFQIDSHATKSFQLTSEQRFQLWNIYKERVEPLVKLFHLPTLEQTMLDSHHNNSLDGEQCIFLAVYYGAITSLTDSECMGMFRESQAQTLGRIREALEIMFSEAMLIHTGDIRPLQALILYLTFLRHHDSRRSWNMTGLAVRLAQNFGLHREGSLFGLSKFDMELRRRLWWHVAILDAPSAEDYSGEYTLLEMSGFDTQPPRNLDDAHLYPELMEYPVEVRGFTEMTFTLLQCEITNIYRCMVDSRRLCGNTGKRYADLTEQECSDWIDSCEIQFFDRYLCDCNISNSFHWMTGTLTRMLFNKVRLHGFKSIEDIEMVSDTIHDRLFLAAVEVIELNYQLRTDPRTRPWSWLFSSHFQWHALSLVLVWLQMNPLTKNSRRAWKAVEKAMVLRWEHPSPLVNNGKPQQWRSVTRMLEKARSARREALNRRNRRGSRRITGGGSLDLSFGRIPATDSTNTSTAPSKTVQPSNVNQFCSQDNDGPRADLSNIPSSSAPGMSTSPLLSRLEPNMTMQASDGLLSLEGFPNFLMDDMPDLQSFTNWMSMDLDLPGGDLPDVSNL